MPSTDSIWRFSNIEVDSRQHKVTVAGLVVELERKPLEVLLLLLEQAPDFVPHETILRSVWPGRILNESAVSNAISRIRKAIGDDQQQLIDNKHKHGYRIVPPVSKIQSRERSPHLRLLNVGATVPTRENWTLKEQLGGGGYGEVWLAAHIKTNALRVFKFCQSDEFLPALMREATLFRLLRDYLKDSISIATILDWQFDVNPKFIEMEYHGPDLHTWAKLKGGLKAISLEVRLGIARQIVEAISLAHSIGILHKDIKPSNILVEDQDAGCLIIRLCDFGAGNVLEPSQFLNRGITMSGFTDSSSSAVSGTPMYMAPELFVGKPASVETDVFSLGVLLYQLVRGEWLPISTGWHSEIPDELLRSDIEDATIGDSLKRLSSARLLLNRLDNLVQRRETLAIERDRQQLAAFASEALKRQRDRRPWVVGSFAFLVLTTIALCGMAVREDRAALAAEEQKAIAVGINRQLIEMVRKADPAYGGHYDAKIKDAVILTVPALRKNLGSAPKVEASIDEFMAETLASLSEPRLASELFHRAATLNRQLHGEGAPETETDQLSEINSSIDFEDARDLSRQAGYLAVRMHGQLPSTDRRLWLADEVMARVYTKQGDSEDALKSTDNVISEAGTPTSQEDWIELDRARTVKLISLAGLHRCSDIIELGNAWLPHFESSYGVNGRATLTIHQWLGFAENCVGALKGGPNLNEAKALAEEHLAYEGFSNLLGPGSEEALMSLSILAQIFIDNADYEGAVTLLRKVHDGNEELYGPYSPWTLRPLAMVVYSLDCEGKHADAVSLGRTLLKDGVEHLNSSGYIYREIVLMTAMAELHAEQSDVAAPLVEQSEQMLAVNDPRPTQSELAIGKYLSGMLAQEQRRWQTAVVFLNEAVGLLATSEGPNDLLTLDAKKRLSLALNQVSLDSTGTGSAPTH